MNRKLFAAAFTAFTACGGSQGIEQTEPPAASPPLIYFEGEGIEACGPSGIARGLVVSLTPAVVDEAQHALVATAAHLTITDGDGNAVPFEQVTERVRTRFERTGSYLVTATFADGARVTREVTVVDAVGVRLGDSGRQIVTHDASGDCTQSVTEGPTPVLALNQELHAWILPVDAQNRALLGALELEFSGTASAHKRIAGAPLNSFVLEPTRSGTNVLTITATELQLEQQVSLEAASAPAACPGA
jgi:hypothetical protein